MVAAAWQRHHARRFVHGVQTNGACVIAASVTWARHHHKLHTLRICIHAPTPVALLTPARRIFFKSVRIQRFFIAPLRIFHLITLAVLLPPAHARVITNVALPAQLRSKMLFGVVQETNGGITRLAGSAAQVRVERRRLQKTGKAFSGITWHQTGTRDACSH